MKFRNRLALTLTSAIALGLIVIYFAVGLWESGVFRNVVPNFRGKCRQIENVNGAEDLEYSFKYSVYLISSDNRPEEIGSKSPDGNIFELSKDGAAIRPLITGLSFEFHPHGISIVENDQGTFLFVINHRSEETTVELFEYDGNRLVHARTYEDELLGNANDITAFSKDRFFVTRDNQSDKLWVKKINSYLRLGDGAVVSYDGQSFETRATGLAFANGIVATADRTHLVVAEMIRQNLHVYKIEDGAGHLTEIKTVGLASSPDNLSWDDAGRLWIGAHPNLLKLADHAKNHSATAPAEVLRIRDLMTDKPIIESIFTDDGSHVKAVSVAKRVEDNLVLGTIFDTKILFCQIIPD